MNSLWPSLQHFDPSDPVLHLMGELDEVRRAIALVVANSLRGIAAGMPYRVEISGSALSAIKQAVLVDLIDQLLIESATHREEEDVVSRLVDVLTHYCAHFQPCSDQIAKGKAHLLALLLGTSAKGLQWQAFVLDKLTALLFQELHQSVREDLQGSLVLSRSFMTHIQRYEQILTNSPFNLAHLHGLRSRCYGMLAEAYRYHHLHDRALQAETVVAGELQSALQHLAHGASLDPQQQEVFANAFPSMMLEYIHSANRLAAGYVIAQPQKATEWCTVALDNARALHGQQVLEDRLTVEAMRAALKTCSEVHYADTGLAAHLLAQRDDLRYCAC